MRVSKSKIALLTVAVGAALAATQAQAVLDLTPATPTGSTFFASEIAASTTTPGVLTNAGNIFNVTTPLGIGMSAGQDRYIKVSLSGASFNAAFVSANVTDTTTPFAAGTTVASGGAAGSSSVIVQVTGAAATGNQIADVVQIVLPNLRVTSTAGNVAVTYEVYEFLTQAQAGTPVLYAKSGTLVNFVPALSFARNTSVAINTTTTSAASGFKAFVGGAFVNTSRAQIGDVTLAINATYGPGANVTPFIADGATVATVPLLMNAAGNVLNLAGDFSAANAATPVYTGATCAAAVDTTTPGGSLTANTASIVIGSTAGAVPFAALKLCYRVNGTSILPESNYTATLVPVANAGYTIAALGPLSTGAIIRDGIQLESPWVTNTTGYISRIFLTQTTIADVPFTATVRNAAGVVTGGTLTGTLPAGKMTKIDLATLLPADTTLFPGPYQVTVVANVSVGNITGSYVLTTPSGSVTNTPMYRQSGF